MTAVDLDALDKLREAATAGGWPAVDAMFAVQRALPELLAEVRRGRALREAVDGLAERWRSTSSPLGLQLAGDDLYAVLTTMDPS